jgi:predicted nucleic acid-binding protein
MLAVVSDSSPLIYLARLSSMPLLRRLHEQVIVPQAVWEEIAVGGAGLPESESLKQAVSEGWILVRTSELNRDILGSAAHRLGRGEVEAILLAKQLQALLLTDDADGRALAESIGLQVSGTIGVLIRAKRQGHLQQLKPLLDRLRRETNFRLSEELYATALQAAEEDQSRH